jgi:hypothetical protein
VDATTGAPVARAEVSIVQGQEELRTTTGEDGRFVLPGLDAGKYPLYAVAPGYIREGLNQHGPYLTGIAVGPGLNSDGLTFPLHRQSVATGKVTDGFGDAVRQADVMLIHAQRHGSRSRPQVERTETTNDLGEFRFARLEPGRYWIAVQAQPWYAEARGFEVPVSEDGSGLPQHRRPAPDVDPLLDFVYPVTFYPGVTDDRAAGELDLLPGEKAQADIQLYAVPAVHIRLTNLPADAGTDPNVRAAQTVFGSLPVPLNVQSGVDSAGDFVVSGLLPGEITLLVGTEGDETSSWREITANVSSGDTVDATGSARISKLSGRVIFPAGENVPDQAFLTLQRGEARIAAVPLQKDGSFVIAEVQAGTYHVFVQLPAPEYYVAGISATGAEAVGREITIADAVDAQLTVALGRGTAQLTGVARLDGQPLSGVMILLLPDTPKFLEEDCRMDQSDSDGTFTLQSILPGNYLLLAIADGWEIDRSTRAALKPYLEKAQAVRVSATGLRNVEVAVQRKAGSGEGRERPN